jgi:hypothetical protein
MDAYRSVPEECHHPIYVISHYCSCTQCLGKNLINRTDRVYCTNCNLSEVRAICEFYILNP